MTELSTFQSETGEPSNAIAALLAHPQLRSFIAGLDKAALEEFEASLGWFGIPAGAVLFRQGDIASDVFFVTAGRLGVCVDTGRGEELFAQIVPGEPVGEMAMISNEPRSATVVALRATELIRVPIREAEWLMTSSPELMRYMLRLLANRLISARRPLLKRQTKAIAVLPIEDGLIDTDFGATLHREISALSVKAGMLDGRSSHFTSEAIEAFEAQHDVVLYVADDRSSPWSARCLGQADRVIFFAAATCAPDEEAVRKIAAARAMHRAADLVLLSPAGAARADGAGSWLGRFEPQEIIHIRRGSAADYARAARLAMGRAVGVVFSGGGARAFAHIGVIRALHAARIPIDLVGGTSMGAIVAATTAMAEDAGRIGDMFHDFFVQNKPLNDYTLPLVSLYRGRNMSRLLRLAFADRTIENLWKGLFCVSANLSTGQACIHRRGLVWRAVRASAAIPGIVPPSVEDGEVLVDGGIMNNFPTDIMRALGRGPVIGIDVGTDLSLAAKVADIEEKSLLWQLRNRRSGIPSIIDILMCSGTVGSEEQRRASRAAVDILIQPNLGAIGSLMFDRFHVAIECGYRAAMETLERLERTPTVAAIWPLTDKTISAAGAVQVAADPIQVK